jgi:hypothetical protein
MADFRIRLEARDWFSDLRRGNRFFRIDFDAFYFCFVAGVSTGQKDTVPLSDTAQLVDYFPGPYQNRGRLLVALFLSQELRELGVDISAREAVHSAISSLINPHAPNYLSDSGVQAFNNYAHGGYGVLLDWFGEKPVKPDDFLRVFKHSLDGHLNDE